jgi:hypothetical protein
VRGVLFDVRVSFIEALNYFLSVARNPAPENCYVQAL